MLSFRCVTGVLGAFYCMCFVDHGHWVIFKWAADLFEEIFAVSFVILRQTNNWMKIILTTIFVFNSNFLTLCAVVVNWSFGRVHVSFTTNVKARQRSQR